MLNSVMRMNVRWTVDDNSDNSFFCLMEGHVILSILYSLHLYIEMITFEALFPFVMLFVEYEGNINQVSRLYTIWEYEQERDGHSPNAS